MKSLMEISFVPGSIRRDGNRGYYARAIMPSDTYPKFEEFNVWMSMPMKQNDSIIYELDFGREHDKYAFLNRGQQDFINGKFYKFIQEELLSD